MLMGVGKTQGEEYPQMTQIIQIRKIISNHKDKERGENVAKVMAGKQNDDGRRASLRSQVRRQTASLPYQERHFQCGWMGK